MIARKLILTLAPILIVGISTGKLSFSADAPGEGEIGLKPCPKSPNCVSSQASDDRHFIAAFHYDGTREAALQALSEIVETQPRALILKRTQHYLHAQFKSKVFGFVDDVEFLFSSDSPVIHVRSAAKLGYYDFGVNRRRVEAIRGLFKQRMR